MLTKELTRFCVNACDDFDPVAVFECGQAFRWNMDENGVYWGMAYGVPASVKKEDGKVYILSEAESFDRVWKKYFDLERDYGQLREEISREEKLKKACDFGKGIRILRQEPWEALCSFIISQCNNIPRIKGIVEKLCLLCGEKYDFCGREMFSFPDAKTVATLSEKELSSLRAGYRGAYIKHAAEGVSYGSINLREIMSLSTENAKRELLKIEGVGEKVASCTLLFGMGKLDAFPVDIWMKRAIEEFFGKGKFDYKRFGNLAGLAQQYMFHYMRNGK